MSLSDISTTISLDLYDHDITPSKIKAIALDSKTRYVNAQLTKGGQQYDIGQSTTVTLTIIRPDKTGVQVTGTTYSYLVYINGTETTMYGARAELTQTALAVSGTLQAQFMFTSGEQILRSEIFTINNGVALDSTVSEWAGEYQGYNLDELVQNVNTAVGKVDAMEQYVSELKSGLSNLHDFALALKSSPYSYYPYGTPTAGRRIDAETGEAFDGSANYYAFEKYIEIPKGRIYFECESGASGNIVFYDADKNVVDGMGINTKFVQLIGNHYDNTLATYMRIGIYKSGGIGNTDFNFAYSYDGTDGKPLFRNVNTDQTSYKNNRLTSDFIYADEPMLVTSKDTSKLVFGVLLYDANKTLLKTYYLADAKTINYVSVPKGHYFTVYCDAPNTVQIAPTTELLDVISIEKTEIGFFTFTYNTDFLQLSKVFVGTIENQYSESAMLMHCDSYGSSGLYTYRVAFYPSADSDKPYLTTDAMLEDFFIPARTYFRIILKRRSGTTVVDDFKAISLKDISLQHS